MIFWENSHTLHRTPYTLHRIPYTVHPTPCTLDLVAVLLIEFDDLLGEELALRLDVSAQLRELRTRDSSHDRRIHRCPERLMCV